MFFKQVNDKQIDWRACFFWKRIVEDFEIWTLKVDDSFGNKGNY